MRWAGHVGPMGEKWTLYILLEGKRPLGRPRCRWVENIKMDLVETTMEHKRQLAARLFTNISLTVKVNMKCDV
jgi:hypothetical protein